ncbi:enoyl-CoA hydratase/isomerase family protein [Candidatus Latescibacterota bacterium]
MELTVKHSIDDCVASITLNSPSTGNVINQSNLKLLENCIRQSIDAEDCRVIVLQGKDGVFSKGMDFKGLTGKAAFDNQLTEPYKNILKLIHHSPKPVIAFVDGEVLAGGMGLALCCDIVLATRRSSFGLSEVMFGLIPALVTPVLLKRLPIKKAQYLILSSKTLSADEALTMGLIDELCRDGELARKHLKTCISRLLYSSPKALTLAKSFIASIQDQSFETALDQAQDQLTSLMNDDANTSAIQAFLAGDKPDWAVAYKGKNLS